MYKLLRSPHLCVFFGGIYVITSFLVILMLVAYSGGIIVILILTAHSRGIFYRQHFVSDNNRHQHTPISLGDI